MPLLVLLASGDALASNARHAPASSSLTPASPPPVAALPAPWPQIAAFVPGALLHGSGTFLQGRSTTSGRLLLLEGASLLATFTSGLILFQTGAARDVVGPTALLSVFGVATFGVSFLANVYASFAPAEGLGRPRTTLPLLESRVGYLYVHDPQFEFRHFATTSLDAQLGAFRLGARTAHAPLRDNQRVELLAGYRLLGPRQGEPAPDGSFLELAAGVAEHRFDAEGFLSRQIEGSLTGRLDSRRYLPDVGGAFFEYQAGLGRQWFHFDLPGVDATTPSSLLLARVAFGLYLGNATGDAPGATGGELSAFYDHRHDGLAGGFKTRGIGNGPQGHLGLAGLYPLTPRWGLAGDVRFGSAWLLGLSLVIRAGLR